MNDTSKQGSIHTVQTLADAEPGMTTGRIQWFIVENRAALIDAGVVFYLGKRLLIDRDKFLSFLKTSQ